MPVDTARLGRHPLAMKPIAKAEMLICNPVTMSVRGICNPASPRSSGSAEAAAGWKEAGKLSGVHNAGHALHTHRICAPSPPTSHSKREFKPTLWHRSIRLRPQAIESLRANSCCCIGEICAGHCKCEGKQVRPIGSGQIGGSLEIVRMAQFATGAYLEITHARELRSAEFTSRWPEPPNGDAV